MEIDFEFEGSIILEQLAAIDKLDEFYEAVDSDDFSKVTSLLKSAGVDSKTIQTVLHKMSEGEP